MKNQIIKSYTTWLLESLSLNEAVDQANIQLLAQKQDLEGLYNLLITNDDEATKALPNYQAVMEWWKRGSADLNLWKKFIKTGKAANYDKLNSAKSMYFWMGGSVGTNKNIKASKLSNIESLITALNTTAAAISAIDPADPVFGRTYQLSSAEQTQLTTQVNGWKNIPAITTEISNFIKLVKGKGLDINDVASTLIMSDTSFYSYKSGTVTAGGKSISYADYFKYFTDSLTNTGRWGKDSKVSGSTTFGKSFTALTLDKVKANIATLTSALGTQATIGQYFTAASTMTFDNKKKILDAINLKVQDKVTRANKKATKDGTEPVTSADMIKLATTLLISPKGSAITVQPSNTPTAPVVSTMNGTFPPADGNWNSPGQKKSVNYFPDDSITIKPEMQTELNTAVKQAVDLITTQGGKITAVKVWGTSSTSVVPSSYDTATKAPNPTSGSSAEKNVPLAKDRLASIKAALTSAFTTAGVDTAIIKNDDTQDIVLPNTGDPAVKWNTTTWKNRATDPKVLADYEAKFGKYRYAFSHFEIAFTKTATETQTTEPITTTSSDWDTRISWADESFEFTFPSIGTSLFSYRPSGAPKKKWGSTECPRF